MMGRIYEVDGELSVKALRIAGDGGSADPYLDGADALVTAVGRELSAPFVSVIGNGETVQVDNVMEYR